MKIAAFVFALAGIIYSAWWFALVFTIGLSTRSVPMAIVAAALLAQGYTLLRSKPRSRVYGLISSAALFACSLGIAAFLVESSGSLPISEWPREALSTISFGIGTAAAFGLAFVCLLVDKRAA